MSPAVYNYINLDYLELMSDGDPDMKKTMLEMLMEELPAEFSKMRNLTDSNNWEELGSVSHKMKSTLAFVGNNEMTTSNKELELLAKNASEVNRISELLKILETNLEKVIIELKAEFESLS